MRRYTHCRAFAGAAIVAGVLAAPTSWATCDSTPQLGTVDLTIRNIREIACALDEVANTSGGSRREIINFIRQAPDARVALAVLRQLYPQFAAQDALLERRGQQRANPTMQRTRSHATSRRNTPQLSTLTWFTAAPSEEGPDQTVWLQAGIESSEQGDTVDIAGYESDGTALSIGFDQPLGENFTLGISLGRFDSKVDSDLDGEDESDATDVGVSLSWIDGPHSVLFAVSRSDIETDRVRAVRLTNDRAFALTSSFDSEQDLFSLSYSAFTETDQGFSVSPFVSVTHSILRTDDYVEARGGTLALSVATEDAEQTVASAGVSLGWMQFAGDWLITPSLDFVYERDIRSDAVETSARFIDSTRRFRSEGLDPEDDRWQVGVGLQFIHLNGFSAAVQFATSRRDDYRSNTAIIGLQAQL